MPAPNADLGTNSASESFRLLAFERRKFNPTVILPTFTRAELTKSEHETLASKQGNPFPSSKEFAALDSQQRVDLLRSLSAEFLHTQDQSGLLGALPRLIRGATTQERVTLVDELLTGRRSAAGNHLISAVLRESNDINQLRTIVSAVGAKRLLTTRSASVREFIAWATVGVRMRNIALPPGLSKYSGSISIERARVGLIKNCNEALHIIANSGKFGRSEVVKQFYQIVSNIKTELEDPSGLSTSARRGVQSINSLRKRLDIGLNYAIMLSSDRSRSWRPQDLDEIEDLFKQLPEGKILFTPRLFEIRRVQQDDEDTLGERHEDGLIRILDLAIDDKILEHRNHGVSSLKSVLAHELGHSLQLGATAYRMRFSRKQLQFTGMSDPGYDFGHYMQLSGWEIVAPERYKIAYFGDAVLIDEKLLPLDTPMMLNGQAVQFRFDPDDEVLYAVNPFARYSLGSYAKTNPWEDWAEAFCEYVILPQRLAAVAADKFEYFNEQFGMYSEDRS